MIYYAVNAAIVLFISFIVGNLTINLFKLKEDYFSFASPIGFLVLMAILQIGYYFLTLFNANATVYMKYTYSVFLIMFALGLSNLSIFVKSIKRLWHNKTKIVISIILILASLYLFAFTDINFRLDDMNFYADFIPNRIYNNYPIQIHYSYQGFYLLISSLLGLAKYFTLFGIQSDYLSLGFIQWVPAIITSVTLSFMITDMYSFAKRVLKNKYSAAIVWLFSTIIIYSDYWYNNFLHFGGTLRRLAVIYILLLLIRYAKNRYNRDIYLLSLLFGAYFSISSSGFFLDVIIIFAYIIYEIFNNNHGYIKNALILMLYPVSFACVYNKLFLYLFAILYLICIGLILLKYDVYLEKVLYKTRFIVLFIIPIACILCTYILHLPSEQLFIEMVEGRQFFDNINKFDMIPDLLNITSIDNIIFNGLFWLGILGICIYGILHKDNIICVLMLVIMICFFNPIVYKMISCYITGVAFFRITDIFYNMIFFIYISYILKSFFAKYGLMCSLCVLLVLSAIRIHEFEIPNYNTSDDHNIMFRSSNFSLNLMKSLEEYIIENEEIEDVKNMDTIYIVSHIYGIQYYTDLNVYNQLSDRYSYKIIDNDEFEKTFARRYPGYDLPEADYEKACSLAALRYTKYFIIDAQYNWELQTGLWPCSQVILERENFRVLKFNEEYWQENLDLGYTKDYREEFGENRY